MPTCAIEQVRSSLMALFQDGANAFLAAQDHEPLADEAFAPVVFSEPTTDTVCCAWSGVMPERETWDLRDASVHMTINIWGAGADDVAAQQRAAAIYAALVACLDQDALDCTEQGLDAYVNGSCSQPPEIGPARCVTSDDDQTNNLIWHVVAPVTCPVRTSRPEFAPQEDTP